ncbi:hypothetical protein HDU93_006829 [Gonapodya sp. JEL0774]|nr:hypothetical protein HDU93_006829 [Gonapodya sp. JEL0774]
MSAVTVEALATDIADLVQSFTVAGAIVAAGLYFVCLAWFVYLTARNTRIWTVSLACTGFCAARVAAFVVRAFLPSIPQLYTVFYMILGGGIPVLLVALLGMVRLWMQKVGVDDSTLTFVGRQGVDASKLFNAVLGWYRVLALSVACVMLGFGPATAYILLHPELNPNFRTSWKNMPGYVVMGYCLWATIVIAALAGEGWLRRPGFRENIMRSKGYELAMDHVRRGESTSYLSNHSAQISDSYSLGSADPAEYATRVDIFYGKRRTLERTLWTLFVPSALLILVRMAYAPSVIAQDQFRDPKFAEGIWYPVVVGSEPLTAHPCSKPIAKEGVPTLPNSYYTDPKIFQLELRGIHSRQWMYFCHELRFLTTPVIEMELATFPIVVASVEGALKASVKPRNASEHTRSAHVHVLSGFVFVNLAEQPPPFEQVHSGLLDEFKAVESYFDTTQYDFLFAMELPGKFNWKVFSDNYNECYHCPTAHPGFSKVYKISSYVVDARSEYLHHSVDARDQVKGDVTDVPEEMQLTEKNDNFPLRTKIAYDQSYSELNACMRKYAESHPVAQKPEALEGALFVYVYPNVGINIFGNFFTTLRWNPMDANKTRLETEFFVRKGVSEAELISFSNFIKYVDFEDYVLCEATQENLELGIYRVGVLHPFRYCNPGISGSWKTELTTI